MKAICSLAKSAICGSELDKDLGQAQQSFGTKDEARHEFTRSAMLA